jgi:hypothetical protein
MYFNENHRDIFDSVLETLGPRLVMDLADAGTEATIEPFDPASVVRRLVWPDDGDPSPFERLLATLGADGWRRWRSRCRGSRATPFHRAWPPHRPCRPRR